MTVPVVTIYRASGELIDDCRVFIDLAPLFSASAKHALPLTLSQPVQRTITSAS